MRLNYVRNFAKFNETVPYKFYPLKWNKSQGIACFRSIRKVFGLYFFGWTNQNSPKDCLFFGVEIPRQFCATVREGFKIQTLSLEEAFSKSLAWND